MFFEDVECTSILFKNQTYPKLREGGGYQLCKCKRELQPLSMATLLSPMSSKQCGGNSRTYIKPLQCDLDISPDEEHSSGLMVIAYIYNILWCVNNWYNMLELDVHAITI